MIKDNETPKNAMQSLRKIYIAARRIIPTDADIKTILEKMEQIYWSKDEFDKPEHAELRALITNSAILTARDYFAIFYPIYSRFDVPGRN